MGQAVQTQNVIRNLQEIWHVSLVTLYTAGLLAWATDWLPRYRLAIGRGGALTAGLIPLVGILALVWLKAHPQMAYYQPTLLPNWQSAILIVVIFSAALGLFFKDHLVERVARHEQS
jgi:hypothetical protein